MASGARAGSSHGSGLAFGLLSTACLTALIGAPAARADTAGLYIDPVAIQGRSSMPERPFGLLGDAAAPGAGVMTLGYFFGVASGGSAERPLSVDPAAGAGGVHGASLGYGVTDRLTPFASVGFADGFTTAGSKMAAAIAGATYQLTDAHAPPRFSLTGGVAYEAATGAFGLTTLAAASLDRGPLRLAANLRADKSFAPGRDTIDLFTQLGVSYRVAAVLRLGAEYMGQDLEDLFEADVEGGARQAVGPSVALDLDGGRYQVTVASGFGIGAKSPRAVVRAGVGFMF
jgi:hypothetical protein